MKCLITNENSSVQDVRNQFNAMVDRVVGNLIVEEPLGNHSDMMVRSKEVFGCLELAIDACLILESNFLVQECEVKNN